LFIDSACAETLISFDHPDPQENTHMTTTIRFAATMAVVFLSVTVAQAADPAVKCESGKLKESSKYASCRLKADAKAVTKGVAADYEKCESKFADKWAKTESKAGPGVCPSEGDQASMDARITTDAAEIATLLAGGAVASCGDGAVNGNEQCDTADLAGATCTSLGYTLGGVLGCDAGCGFDTSGCASQQFPASGQTSVSGSGSDGDVQAGAALAYADNGDGTITDLNTGLMWEKKDDSGGIHDKDNTYTWCGASCGTTYEMDGTITTTFLDTLNDVGGGGASCFAGHCDWRIPNYKELVSIVNLEVFSPSVDPAFHQAGTCTACADVTLGTCSCTASSNYGSSTTFAADPVNAWLVDFNVGDVFFANKAFSRRVRAVRGGL
jgi:hypothetical protein